MLGISDYECVTCIVYVMICYSQCVVIDCGTVILQESAFVFVVWNKVVNYNWHGRGY